MNDRRIDRVDRPRDEGMYVPGVQEDKKDREKFSTLPPKNGKKILLATFFSYLKKMFDAFSPSKKLAGKVVDQQSIIENLLALKTFLEKLTQQDLSTSSEYASNLSDIWRNLLEDFDNIEILERKNLKELASFREMMELIRNYPPDSEHSFGYYLLQQAGKDWLPFPFIELLERLHQEHQEDSSNSTLKIWLEKIDLVITNMKRKISFKPGTNPENF